MQSQSPAGHHGQSTCPKEKENGSKPAEIFRKDLISAMKLPDGQTLQSGEYHIITDSWKLEWERGVQVCVNEVSSLKPHVRRINKSPKKRVYTDEYKLPKQRIKTPIPCQSEVTYDLDQMDLCWLKLLNRRRRGCNRGTIELECFEKAITHLELECHRKFVDAIATNEGLGIEYDASIPCDVCGETDGEEGNEMIFCDVCNVCVHQACYGIQVIPDGCWLCRPCMQNVQHPECVLCPNEGGALKPIRFHPKWCHVRCALWIPEVGVGNVDRMEPITKTELIPQSRWNLVCTICKRKQGACIQCSVKSCTVAYHVTCAVKAGIYMKTILDTTENKLGHVRHVSHCPKHTKEYLPNSISLSLNSRSDMSRGNIRESRLKRLEDNVHTLVSPKDVVDTVNVSERVASLIYNYWKMKRRAQGNCSLLDFPDPKKAAEDLKRHNQLTVQTSDLNWEAYSHQKVDLDKLLTLRTDMEKARNLSYMLIRRERWKKKHVQVHRDLNAKRCQLALEEAKREAKDKSKRQQKGDTLKGRRCSVKEWASQHGRRPGGDDGPFDGKRNDVGWNGVRLRPRRLAQQSRDRKSGQKRDGGGSENDVRCEKDGETEQLLVNNSNQLIRVSTTTNGVRSVLPEEAGVNSTDVNSLPLHDNETNTIQSSRISDPVTTATSVCFDRVRRKRKSGISCDDLLVSNLQERASLEAIVNCLKFKHARLIEENLEEQQDCDSTAVGFNVGALQELIESQQRVRSWVARASQALGRYEEQLVEPRAMKVAYDLRGEFERLLQCAFPRHSAQLLRDVERRRRHNNVYSKRRCMKSSCDRRGREEHMDERLSSVLLTPEVTPADSPSSRKALSSPLAHTNLPLMPSPASSDELIVVV
ncbi:protein Jade-1-like isoform X2 [Corticium candelabrum]|uniref:protein Jade-1-like isoform X2 n=1 Tax=Corticium candelabrum TaxID=121492 RepID=UPI002E262995|nr:protein Jade-1-like isoform X2 [Corticium candelabrum]